VCASPPKKGKRLIKERTGTGKEAELSEKTQKGEKGRRQKQGLAEEEIFLKECNVNRNGRERKEVLSEVGGRDGRWGGEKKRGEPVESDRNYTRRGSRDGA